MIDREEEIKQLSYEVVGRYPQDILLIKIDGQPIGTIYIKNDTEYRFWKSTLEMMNEKLRQRELSL